MQIQPNPKKSFKSTAAWLSKIFQRPLFTNHVKNSREILKTPFRNVVDFAFVDISCSLNSPNFNFVYCEEVFVLGGDTQSCLTTLTSSCIFPFRSQATAMFRSKFNCGLIWLFRAWKQQTRVVHNLIRYDDSPEFRISFSSRHVLFMTVALARLF